MSSGEDIDDCELQIDEGESEGSRRSNRNRRSTRKDRKRKRGEKSEDETPLIADTEMETTKRASRRSKRKPQPRRSSSPELDDGESVGSTFFKR